jgi:hypothetical protein
MNLLQTNQNNNQLYHVKLPILFSHDISFSLKVETKFSL